MNALTAAQRQALQTSTNTIVNDPNSTTVQKVAALISLLQGLGIL